MNRTRRGFLADVGRGMLIASVGPALAADLGVGSVFAEETGDRLTFGKLEPLVALMQETPADKLLPLLVARMENGTELGQLVSAAALANARTFGGEDYVGFHTLMALYPAYHMARELPKERQPLPVLKVLYRNSNRIQEKGGSKEEVLKAVAGTSIALQADNGRSLREMMNRKDVAGADTTVTALARQSPEAALNDWLPSLHEAAEVHRVVLVSRAWDLLDLVGREQAATLLRQSVHYCIKACSDNYNAHFSKARDALAKSLDQHKLIGLTLGKKQADDAWVDKFSQTLFNGTPEQAADAAAAALAEGMAPDAIGEAMTLAANQLVLRDKGRPANQTSANKPEGSIHGDSIGVHACDSANAWRNIAKVSNPRNCAASLILGAYQVAYDRINRSGDFLKWEPYPLPEAREQVKSNDPETLLRDAEAAIKDKDQVRAAACIHRYGEQGHSHRPVFDLLLKYAVSEDGALHAEKYYRTVTEEFNGGRPAFRWRQLVALARVTASAYGQPAPGYAEACGLLKV